MHALFHKHRLLSMEHKLKRAKQYKLKQQTVNAATCDDSHLEKLASIMCILEQQEHQGKQVQHNDAMKQAPHSWMWPY